MPAYSTMTTKFSKWQHAILRGLSILLLLNGCKKAENEYQKLYNEPEAIQNYNKVYSVGDTLMMQGRLNPKNNLVIHIGNADAKIIATARILFRAVNGSTDSVDAVSILISADMGIGPARPVQITSAGNIITAAPIEIVANANMGYLKNPLKAVSYYQLQTGQKTLYCQNGKGSIYIWNTDNTVTCLKADGSTTQVMGNNVFSDSYGKFTVVTLNSGGVNPQENALYFSAVTTDGSADNAANNIYRLCKYDFATKQLTTLNRTVYAHDSKQHTLAAAQPFEGTVATIKMYNAMGIYPDSKGNVYFRMGTDDFLTKLDNTGNYRYIFNNDGNNTSPSIPEIIGISAAHADSHQLFPGIITRVGQFAGLDPENGLIYGITYGLTSLELTQYDIENQVKLFAMPNTWAFSPLHTTRIYLSGSFGILTGPFHYDATSTSMAPFGFMSLPGQKLLMLMYQELETNSMWASQVPAWEMLDFNQKTGSLYAPGKFQFNGYQMTANDVLLNYDSNGMLYMTANSGTVIVKTANQ